MFSGYLARARTGLLIVAMGVMGVLVVAVGPGLIGAGSGTTASAAGVRITMQVNGAKQGSFKGDDTAAKNPSGTISVTSVELDGAVAAAQAGAQVGRFALKPVVVTHVMGGSSPQFLTAMANGEQLRVTVSFTRPDNTGREAQYYALRLDGATVSEVKDYGAGGEMLEDVSFTPRTVTIDDQPAGTHFNVDLSKSGA